MIRLISTREASARHGVKVLVYGEAGTGKTKLCSTAPRPVVISAEAGLLSLRMYDIPVIEIHTLDQLGEAYAWASSSHEARSNFWTLCLDSVTEIAEVVLANAKDYNKDPRKAYGDTLDRMLTIIKGFRDLSGYHVYMSAKAEPQKDEMTGITRWGPGMPGSKLGNQLPYLFDEVFRLRIGSSGNQTFRYLQTQPDMQNVAKDRAGCLEAVERPDLGYIFNRIIGG